MMKARLLQSLLCFLPITIAAHASPMPLCVGSALSANGRVLVTRSLTFDDPDPSDIRKVTGSTHSVTTALREPNSSLSVAGPDHYWPDPDLEPYASWTVAFTRRGNADIPACEHLFVTDDAKYLILLADNLNDHSALQIYRCCQQVTIQPGKPYGPAPGTLVRTIPLSDIIPASQLPFGYTNHTPQWYSQGTWSFSPDNRALDFRRATGGTVRINLATGTVQPGKL